jgi:hypothetical protein
MSLPTDLLQNLGYLPTGGDITCPKQKKRRNRHSKFLPYRQKILDLHGEGKSLAQILNHLTYKHADADLPSSRSQLLRFIRKCLGGVK